jgi:hypothetical protein
MLRGFPRADLMREDNGDQIRIETKMGAGAGSQAETFSQFNDPSEACCHLLFATPAPRPVFLLHLVVRTY